ncbi:hypothetical protein BC829DRAFT_398851 [Chytridium lagenaria]|nr:hypothetical protein BC829DRAFT_398851 [Chytridium lagenaria]
MMRRLHLSLPRFISTTPIPQAFHRRRPPPHRTRAKRTAAMVGAVLLTAAGGGTSLVLMQSKEPMTPMDALGVAVAGVGRAVVSLVSGLFGRFEEYQSEEYKVRVWKGVGGR